MAITSDNDVEETNGLSNSGGEGSGDGGVAKDDGGFSAKDIRPNSGAQVRFGKPKTMWSYPGTLEDFAESCKYWWWEQRQN